MGSDLRRRPFHRPYARDSRKVRRHAPTLQGTKPPPGFTANRKPQKTRPRKRIQDCQKRSAFDDGRRLHSSQELDYRYGRAICRWHLHCAGSQAEQRHTLDAAPLPETRNARLHRDGSRRIQPGPPDCRKRRMPCLQERFVF